jgi:hypothetical protein
VKDRNNRKDYSLSVLAWPGGGGWQEGGRNGDVISGKCRTPPMLTGVGSVCRRQMRETRICIGII